jgi:cytochrome c biogenesis protein CcdA
MDALSPLLGLLAGVLSILSPCVLPLIPIVLTTAGGRSRWGPLALGAGLALSFAALGLFVALIGFSIGIDGDVLRRVGGLIMLTLGVLLLTPRLQIAFASMSTPLSSWVNERTGSLSDSGVTGQFALGLVLGLVWTPCVGPTLGAAALLASRGQDLLAVGATMTAFAIGAAASLTGVGLLWQKLSGASRGRIRRTAGGGKALMGSLFVLLGLLALSGLDKLIEAWLVSVSPEWLTRLTTSI